MTGQRTWKRVEAPGTFRGHALESTIGGTRYVGWENRGGSWSLSINGADPIQKANWGEVRGVAERNSNPVTPIIASAAAGGMAFAMREFLMNNPGSGTSAGLTDSVLRAIPQGVLLAAPREDRYGNVWLLVRRGSRRSVRRAVRRARFSFNVQIVESHL